MTGRGAPTTLEGLTVVAGYELADLLALRELSRDALAARVGGLETDPDVGYEGLAHLDRLHDPASFPGDFYFRQDRLAMLSIPRSALEDAEADTLRRELGKPAAALRTRAGEDASLLVYPERGVAFASDGKRVELLEVFPPTTLKAYVAAIYDPPR